MDERFVTPWARRWEAVPASMFARGPADTTQIGTCMPQSRAIQRGDTKPFLTCIAAGLRRGLDPPIRIIAVQAGWCTYNRHQNLTHSQWLCWRVPNPWA